MKFNSKLILYVLAFLSVFYSFLFDCKAQSDNRLNTHIKNSIYLELGGSGLWYSLNYDHVLKQNEKICTTGRIGLSALVDSSDFGFSVPVSVSALIGKKNNFLELGGGPTLLLSPKDGLLGAAAIGIIGYRHYPLESKRIMLKISANPFVATYSKDRKDVRWTLIPWGGLGIGIVL